MPTISDLDSYVERLIRAAGNDSAFLIVTVSGTEDFVQLIADIDAVELDFPLVTGRQMSFESKFRDIAEIEGYSVIENRGDDGARFLDVELPFSTDEVTRVTEVFLNELFGVGERTQLDFEGDLEISH